MANGKKISVKLHIDTSEAEALVKELALQLRASRSELKANAIAMQAIFAEADSRLRMMIDVLHVASQEHAREAEATLTKIDGAFAKWSE
jgi:polyhydroxyalkanoate synthesis regulator phasin